MAERRCFIFVLQLVQLTVRPSLKVAHFPLNDYSLDCAELGSRSGWLDDCVIETAEFHWRRTTILRGARKSLHRFRLLSTICVGFEQLFGARHLWRLGPLDNFLRTVDFVPRSTFPVLRIGFRRSHCLERESTATFNWKPPSEFSP